MIWFIARTASNATHSKLRFLKLSNRQYCCSMLFANARNCFRTPFVYSILPFLAICKSHGYCRHFELISRLLVFFYVALSLIVAVVTLFFYLRNTHKLDRRIFPFLRSQNQLVSAISAFTIKYLQILFAFHFRVYWWMLFSFELCFICRNFFFHWLLIPEIRFFFASYR